MPAPIIAALVRAAVAGRGAASAASASGSAARAASAGKTAAGAGQTNFAAKDLFKQAFTKGGMADPSQLTKQQEATAATEKETAARAEASEKLKDLGKSALKGAAAFVALPPAMLAFSHAVLRSQEELRAFSTKTALAFNKLEAGRFSRQQTRAMTTEKTTEQLAEAINSLEETLSPYLSVLANVLNILATAGVKAMESLVVVLKYISPLANAAINKMEKNEAEAKKNATTAAFDTLDRIAAAGKDQRNRFPPNDGKK